MSKQRAVHEGADRRTAPGLGARSLLAIGSIALIAAASMVPTVQRSLAPPTAEVDVRTRPVEVQVDGYVSSSRCRACHAREYSTWHDSYHRRMTQRADAAAVVGDFDGVTLTTEGKDYHLARDGDQYFVELENPLAFHAGQPKRVRQRVVMTTGSHNMQAYWYESGHTTNIGLLPFTWLVAEQRWITRRAAFVGPASDEVKARLGDWNIICLKCHSTHARPRIMYEGNVQQGAFTQVAEFGIACEACHGPGDAHIAANQNPARRYALHLSGDADPTIVNPRRLDPKRSAEVCGQCHASLDYRFDEPRLKRWFRDGFAYRPGEQLARYYDVKFHGEEQFWSDGLIRVAGREFNSIIGSGCFDRGPITCLSCHALHQAADDPRPRSTWADDQLRDIDGDRMCLQCHEQLGADVAAHTHHAAGSDGSRCLNCHMPYTTYGLMKGVRTHRIASPSVQSTLATGRPNACNQCHLDKPLAWTAQQLAAWYGTAVPAMAGDDRDLAPAVRAALSGDAASRALVACSLGWEPAQRASGTDWMAPLLAELLADPYEVVRLIAERSLRTLPGFGDFRQQLVEAKDGPRDARAEALRRWQAAPRSARADGASVLLQPDGTLCADVVARLLRARDTKVIRLFE